MVLEPDALPVQAGWLERIAHDVRALPPTLLRGMAHQEAGGPLGGRAEGGATGGDGGGGGGDGGGRGGKKGGGGPWVLGSVAQCDGRYGSVESRRDLHLNGNALYGVGDPSFADDFLGQVQAFYPAFTGEGISVAGCSTGVAEEGGHDHAMHRFLMVCKKKKKRKAAAYRSHRS